MHALWLQVDSQRLRRPQGVPQLQELPLEGTQKMKTPRGCVKWVHQYQGWGSCPIWKRDNAYVDDPNICGECPLREEKE